MEWPINGQTDKKDRHQVGRKGVWTSLMTNEGLVRGAIIDKDNKEIEYYT